MFSFRTVGLLPRSAFFQGFLRLADDPLNFPGCLFHRAFDLQPRIIRELPCLCSEPCLLVHETCRWPYLSCLVSSSWLLRRGFRAAVPVQTTRESGYALFLQRMMRRLPRLSRRRFFSRYISGGDSREFSAHFLYMLSLTKCLYRPAHADGLICSRQQVCWTSER